ncbi:hypothetical protein EC9_23290 [Rosistilla ulvae]|uniref:Uncharacterized protein n=2 Tax=Rosistilla ulvae TaxID=1930277 RepID=A0A517LZU6_9BACT|nr:hypothetical protein EC9_23290 [Rosistilla ulvae]
MLMLRQPTDQNADMEFSTVEAASLPRAVSLKADRDVEPFEHQSPSELQAGYPDLNPLPDAPRAVAAAIQQVPSVPLSQVHDVFFTPGDVFIGRSVPSANSARRNHAPRIQANPFAQ